jgi:succinate dehydrogenase / fumarate reductase flavoprotein subunit
MTEHAGVVRSEAGLLQGLTKLQDIESQIERVGVHPDIASFQDLSHAFDLRSSAIAARATLEAALERRETRGCHNRSDFPDTDPSLQVNLVWSGPGRLARETIPPAPDEIVALMHEVSTAGKHLE